MPLHAPHVCFGPGDIANMCLNLLTRRHLARASKLFRWTEPDQQHRALRLRPIGQAAVQRAVRGRRGVYAVTMHVS
jgi:hypothetical protein